ncbi:hypothetical protein C8R44DRAFT_749264 [Mycena epipterygia]|nr:hypothetical protein C8R44DRAFT_749264 [Mycena epipterygia]
MVGEVGIYEGLDWSLFSLTMFEQRLSAWDGTASLVAENQVLALGGIAGFASELIHLRLMREMTRPASCKDPGFGLKFECFERILQGRRKLGKNIVLFGCVAGGGRHVHRGLDDHGNRVNEKIAWVSGQPDDNVRDYREQDDELDDGVVIFNGVLKVRLGKEWLTSIILHFIYLLDRYFRDDGPDNIHKLIEHYSFDPDLVPQNCQLLVVLGSFNASQKPAHGDDCLGGGIKGKTSGVVVGVGPKEGVDMIERRVCSADTPLHDGEHTFAPLIFSGPNCAHRRGIGSGSGGGGGNKGLDARHGLFVRRRLESKGNIREGALEVVAGAKKLGVVLPSDVWTIVDVNEIVDAALVVSDAQPREGIGELVVIVHIFQLRDGRILILVVLVDIYLVLNPVARWNMRQTAAAGKGEMGLEWGGSRDGDGLYWARLSDIRGCPEMDNLGTIVIRMWHVHRSAIYLSREGCQERREEYEDTRCVGEDQVTPISSKVEEQREDELDRHL